MIDKSYPQPYIHPQYSVTPHLYLFDAFHVVLIFCCRTVIVTTTTTTLVSTDGGGGGDGRPTFPTQTTMFLSTGLGAGTTFLRIGGGR